MISTHLSLKESEGASSDSLRLKESKPSRVRNLELLLSFKALSEL
jgi:hypothetical protein